jgi:hypothetical protein
VDLHELKPKIINQEHDKINSNDWHIRFPLDTKNCSNINNITPFFIGGEAKTFIGTDENGYVYFWKGNENKIEITLKIY